MERLTMEKKMKATVEYPKTARMWIEHKHVGSGLRNYEAIEVGRKWARLTVSGTGRRIKITKAAFIEAMKTAQEPIKAKRWRKPRESTKPLPPAYTSDALKAAVAADVELPSFLKRAP